MTKLNAGGDTLSGVHYTVIESQNDEVVTPYQSAFLTGPSSQVTNIDAAERSARSTRVSTCRCPTTTSPTPTC